MDEQSLFADFERFHSVAINPTVRQIERRVLGSDYGVTSYTTVLQADEIADLLGVGAGQILLDLGTGTGWPGLHIAKTTGCRVVLADVPLGGLRVARERAIDDGLDQLSRIVGASADALPFCSGAFDAVTHTDVLC